MSQPDFNLLITLDVLLEEGNVTRAAQHLKLSASAMSRALARLRATTGDPLLVRAGRGLVPTPRALELRAQVRQLVQEAESVLRPLEQLDLQQLTRTFTLRVRDGFVENFGSSLLTRINQEAPQVRLYFVPKFDKDSRSLRDASVDLELGVIGKTMSPEIRTQGLFRDHFIGVVPTDHPLSQGEITVECYAAGQHVVVSRDGLEKGLIDTALASLGLERKIVTLVSDFSSALALARNAGLIATVPEHYTGNLRAGLHSFALPFPPPQMTISMFWHPRMDADPAHRWLRSCVKEVCAEVLS
ncbi:MAG TPA: LysR family transcriptional regulator [Thiolinea sp.]|nr:LysR family transcriptional regulator [Thiolinea sp.]